MRMCHHMYPVSLQRANFIPFSSVRLGRHSGLSGGTFLTSCFRSVVPVKEWRICNSEQANKLPHKATQDLILQLPRLFFFSLLLKEILAKTEHKSSFKYLIIP